MSNTTSPEIPLDLNKLVAARRKRREDEARQREDEIKEQATALYGQIEDYILDDAEFLLEELRKAREALDKQDVAQLEKIARNYTRDPQEAPLDEDDPANGLPDENSGDIGTVAGSELPLRHDSGAKRTGRTSTVIKAVSKGAGKFRHPKQSTSTQS